MSRAIAGLAGGLTLVAALVLPVRAAAPADSIAAPADPIAAPADSIAAPADSIAARVAPSLPPQRLAFDRPLVEPDTSRFRLEIGARSDLTNESYYEDAFVDTTFLGRRLVRTPEERYAAMLVGTLDGTRGLRATRYSARGEIDAGDLLQRGYGALQWRSSPAPDWTLHLSPSAEYRRDRTFDRDLEEWRATLGGRLRRDFADGLTGAELGLRGDLLRASGRASDFLLDRNAAGVSAGLDHFGLAGGEWRLGLSVTGRSFPDSSLRDHLEQGAEGRWRWAPARGPAVTLEGTATRRRTFHDAPTSRDDFLNAGAEFEARFGSAGRWPVTARLGGETFRYDVEDSILFFDYRIARARASLGWEPDARWTLAAGPRAEALAADLDPGEGYREIAGVIEAERLRAGSWWSATLAYGWREYDSTPAVGPEGPPLHSSFAFHEIEMTADQPLSGHLKLRLLAVLRWESHVDPAQDANSLYVTSEIRWRP